MSISVAGKTKRIGLALSGGGFRAAGFHLGVLLKLDELRLLEHIDVLSCVSGGSIAGGTVAKHWQTSDRLTRLESYLLNRSVAVSSVLGGMIDPFHTRLEKLAATYDRDLFDGARLKDLSQGPRTYFNATCLATGNLFFFVTGGGGASEMGEHELKYQAADDFALSHAVAASSAFPPVFPPLRLDPHVYLPKGDVEYVTLTDGGVYDNMGVNPLFAKTNALDYMIVSDGGLPFAVPSEPTTSGALVLKAGIDIMMEQIRGLQFDRMKYRHLADVGPKPLWFSIDSTTGEAEEGDAEASARIPTNLAALSRRELDTLKRHGGALVEHRIRAFAPELVN